MIEEACDRIARDLALRGVKTYTGRPCGYTMVYRMLHNEKYRGMYSWGGVTRADGMPRIVDDGLFFAVQGVRGRKARAGESWGDCQQRHIHQREARAGRESGEMPPALPAPFRMGYRRSIH